MRVAVISSNQYLNTPGGGVWNLVHSRNVALGELGIEVLMVCGFAEGPNEFSHLYNNSYKTEVLRCKVPKILKTVSHCIAGIALAQKLAKRAMAFNPDAIIVLGDHSIPGVVRAVGRKVPIILDWQGSVKEGLDCFRGNPRALMRYWKAVRFLRKWLPKIQGVMVVTDYLGDECRQFAPDIHTFTVPCASVYKPQWQDVIRDRAKWREYLGVKDEFVLAHSGSLEFYTKAEDMIQLIGLLLDAGFPAKLLWATPSIKEGQEYRRRMPDRIAKNIIVRNFARGEHLNALAAADVGLLLRDGISTNYAAFPNKVDEYWAVGLPVIVTEGLQAVAKIVKNNPCAGISINNQLSAGIMKILEWLPKAELFDTQKRMVRFSSLLKVRQSIGFRETLTAFREYCGMLRG
jgi:glycosyltransferase involved in cell wall biosynthesis